MSMPSKIPDSRSRDHPWRHLPGAIGSHVDAAIRGIAGDIQSVLRGDRQVVRPDAILQPHLLRNRSGLLTGTVWKEIVPIRFNFPDSMKGFEKYANPIIKRLDPVIKYLSPGVITTQVGGIFDYCFSTNRARVMIGLEHQLDDVTTLKGRLSSAGWATALVNRRIGEKAVVTISSEVNLNDLQGPPRIGIRLSLP